MEPFTSFLKPFKIYFFFYKIPITNQCYNKKKKKKKN